MNKLSNPAISRIFYALACAAPSAHAGQFSAASLGTSALSAIPWALALLTLVLLAYGVRHYIYTLNRLYAPQKRTFEGVQVAQWPRLVVFIAAHNEEAVVANCIEALVNADYPHDRLKIIPVNDRSKDRTKEICNEWALKYPHLLEPFHRTDGKAGKPAALMDAAKRAPADTEVYVIFDADYIPGRGLLKQIVSPFLDPEIGVTMGRVVPCNVSSNLLTRMLDMERSAGYQGDQQARQNMGTSPQFGGTVGGIRVKALNAVGGFREDVLAEDTDLTFRLLSKGWKVSYVNAAECYEEVPETWPVRVKQLMRWAKGHNQVFVGFIGKTFRNPHLSSRERLDAVMLLGCYAVAPLTLLGWIVILSFYFAAPTSAWLAVGSSTLALVLYGGFGNSAAFFQMAAAIRLDGNARRLRLLPLNFIGYIVSAATITRGTFNLLVDSVFKRELVWDKTVRFRKSPATETATLASGAPAISV
jgi:cellulose synthase/poly-beta-1,6-N-acetylglucosamine synthase-like glycosyltransferase